MNFTVWTNASKSSGEARSDTHFKKCVHQVHFYSTFSIKIGIAPLLQAEAIMEKSLGRPSSAIFARLSDEPVAAASLGQVYRGRLHSRLGGDEVAVKVQRPGVLKSVALDLYLMRRLATVLDRSVRYLLTLQLSFNRALEVWFED